MGCPVFFASAGCGLLPSTHSLMDTVLASLPLPLQGGDLCTALAGGDAHDLQWYRLGKEIMLGATRGVNFLHSHHVHGGITSKVGAAAGRPTATAQGVAIWRYAVHQLPR